MIDLDLERELAPLVERAPEPPPTERVRASVRRRRTRRRALGAGLVAAALVAATASALVVTRHRPTTVATTPDTSVPPIAPDGASPSTVNVTAPDGTTYRLSGAPGLGLPQLSESVRFNAQISPAPGEHGFAAQPITVQDIGAPTPQTCWFGFTYGHWRLLINCQSAAADQRIHDLLHGRIDRDGFLVFDPQPGLVLGPTDAPTVELGDDAIGIFGPTSSSRPGEAGVNPGLAVLDCPVPDTTTTHTASGEPVRVDATGAWWCLTTPTSLRVHVGDQSLIAAALQTLRVQVDDHQIVTSPYGTTIDIDAPFALGSARFDATVVDPSRTRTTFSATVGISTEAPPAEPPGAAEYPTSDGRMLFVAKSGLGQDELFGSWHGFTIDVTADGLPDAERGRIASLLRFRDRNGFAILDPVPPLLLEPSGGTEIIFDGVRIDGYPAGCPAAAASALHTPEGVPVRHVAQFDVWCDPNQRLMVWVEPPAPIATAVAELRVTRVG